MITAIRSMLVILGVTLALAFGPTPVAQAQVTLDVSKLTCGQFLSYKITTGEKIAAWLSGFHNGKRDNTSLDTHALIANAKKLRSYCVRNSETLVMNAVETVLGAAK
jgi:acid stress chaperone HdeB